MKTRVDLSSDRANAFARFGRSIFSTALLLLAPPIEAAGLDYFRVVGLGALRFSALPSSYRDFHVNDNGQVVGKTNGPVSDQAAIWQNGTITGLGYWGTGATFSDGHAINNAGDVALYGNDVFGNFIAFRRKAGGAETSCLYPTGYNFSSATGIDSAGHVVGWAKSGTNLYGRGFYAVTDGNTHPPLLPSLSFDSYSMVTCINESGTLIGGCSYTNPNSPTAVVWTPAGVMQQVGNLFQSSVEDVNSSGIAVGYNGGNAVAYDSSGIVPLTAGVACAINNSNFIVGNTAQSVTASNSLAWFKAPTGTTIYSLTALQNSSRTLYTASDINAKLQIVGQSSSGPYIATPVLYRLAGGAWSTASAWQWGLVPSAISPVVLSSNSAITVTGPTTPTTVAELTVGGNVRFELSAGQSMTLQGGNFGSGMTTVAQGGTFVLNGQLTSPVTVAGVLAGTASVNGPVTVQSGGVVAPGNSPGTVSVNGNFQMSAGALAAMELNGLTPGTQYDQIQVSGTVNLGGASLALALGAGFTLAPGYSFILLNNLGTGAVTGTFAGLSEGAVMHNFLNSGCNAMITYTGGTGNDVVLTIVARSSDAALAVLGSAGAASITPVFAPEELSYTVKVGALISSIVFQTQTTDAYAAVQINGQAASTAFDLSAGTTPFDFVVTAEDGTTTRTYHVDVVHLSATYGEWKSLKFGAAATDPAVAGDDVCPGGDRIPNLMKYYFGLEPLANESKALPQVSVESGYLCLTYRRMKAMADAVGLAQWSKDLKTWSTLGVIEEVLPAFETPESQMMKAKVPVGSPENVIFMRLEVKLSP